MVKCHSNRLSSRGAASKSGLGPASDIYETRGQDGLEGGTGRVRRSPRRRRTSLASRRMRFTAGLLVLADMLLILSSALGFLPGCPTATATTVFTSHTDSNRFKFSFRYCSVWYVSYKSKQENSTLENISIDDVAVA